MRHVVAPSVLLQVVIVTPPFLSRYSVAGMLITSKQGCLKISTETSRDSDESLKYSGRLFQTAGPEQLKAP